MEQSNTLLGHAGPIWKILLLKHGNGSLLASSSEDCTMKFWDWASGECIKTFLAHS